MKQLPAPLQEDECEFRRIPDHHSAPPRHRTIPPHAHLLCRHLEALGLLRQAHARPAQREESAFSYYGPMSLIFCWRCGPAAMVVGFALIYYALGSPFIDGAQGAGIRRTFT
jgi:hypothetical protein